MPEPGANRSTQVPTWRTNARASVLVVAPTVSALGTRAGDCVHSDVRAVTVAVDAVLLVTNGIEAHRRATTEVGHCRADAGVDDVRGHVRACARRRVRVVERQVALVDAVETPRRCGRLRGRRADVAVLLHRRDGRVLAEVGRLLRRHPRGVTRERLGVGAHDAPAVAGAERRRGRGRGSSAACAG